MKTPGASAERDEWRLAALTIAILTVAATLAGCPAAECRSEGTCSAGTACDTASDCASGACGPLMAGAPTECLAPCTGPAECGASLVCVELAPGASFCQRTPVDGGIDGGSPADSGTPTDAGPPVDTGPEVDGDGDGVPSSIDCDDADPAISGMSVSSCMSACGFGTIVCTRGARTTCSAPTDCGCPTPGTVETIACGRCGTTTRTCGADNQWSAPSACTSERECMAGSVEARSERCGQQERTCDGMCAWRDWSDIVPPGECEPGGERTERSDLCGAGGEEVFTCGEDCAYGTSSGCRALCTTTPRVSRTGLTAVCVPAGPFVIGSGALTASMPQKTISLSEFWIAQEPVTAAAYRRCVEVSGCTAIAATDFATADANDAAIGATQAQAAAFCAWDGGTLTTEFQWEKAARGPAPDARPHPWGDGPATVCEVIPGPGCEYPPDTRGLPESYSPFRVHLMGTIYEWTSTRFRTGWSWVPDGATDPGSPPAATYSSWSRRGYPAQFGEVAVPTTTAARGPRDGTESDMGFRCVY